MAPVVIHRYCKYKYIMFVCVPVKKPTPCGSSGTPKQLSHRVGHGASSSQVVAVVSVGGDEGVLQLRREVRPIGAWLWQWSR